MERELFDLNILVGNWESVSLNPTVIIHRNGENHQSSIIHMNETTKQVSPATYEIQEDEKAILCTSMANELRFPIAKDWIC